MNINQIAKQAGVSRATVSRYLNNGYVSKEKRERIARVIKETGYVPSRRAQQLRTGKTQLVGVVIPKVNSQSVSRMVLGITDVLSQNDYQLVLANTNNSVRTEIEYLEMFSSRNHVDGVIHIATELNEDHLRAAQNMRMPLVVLAQKLPGCACVYHSDFEALHDITKLVLRKAQRPAYLGVTEQDRAAGLDRHRGFLAACAEMGVSCPPEAQVTVDFTADSGYFGAERILETVPDVDTIVCATDDIAFGAMMCMAEYGRRVPEDVQITGVGDSLLSRISRPSLTTAHLHFRGAGQEAARLLLEQIETGERIVDTRQMGYEVYGRSSMR